MAMAKAAARAFLPGRPSLLGGLFPAAAASKESLADYWLRKALEAELPILGDPSASEFEKVEALRGWVCRSVPRAPRHSPYQLSAERNAGWDRHPVAQVLYLSARHRAAAMCGGAAQILLKVYRLFGFEGFVYGFGEPDSDVTHVVTVVRVACAGRSVFAVEDAHFNLCVADADGAAVDFFTLLDGLRERRHAEFRLVNGRDAEHDYLPSPIADSKSNDGRLDADPAVRRKEPNLEAWIASKPMEALAPGLDFPASFLDLFTRPMFLGLGRGVAGGLKRRLRALLPWRIEPEIEPETLVPDEGDREAADYWFRRYLEAHYPVLKDPVAGDVEKAHALRAFVFHHVNRSPRDPVLQLSERWGNDYYQRSAPELFRAFLSKEGSAMCHGNAYALVRVCELFGLPAFIYNMGIPEAPFTHAVVVVTVRDGGGTRAIVEDAHFGMTVEDQAGGPVDFFDMLARLRERRHETLRMRFQEDLTTPYLLPENHGVAGLDLLDDMPPSRLENGYLLYRLRMDLENWCSRRDMPALLRERGFPPEFLYLYCLFQGTFVAGGSTTREAQAMERRIQGILLGDNPPEAKRSRKA